IAAAQVFVTSPVVGNAAVSLFGLFGALVMARTMPANGGRWVPGALLFLLVAASPWWVVYTNSTWPSYVVTGTAACFVAAQWRDASHPRSRAVGPLAFM